MLANGAQTNDVEDAIGAVARAYGVESQEIEDEGYRIAASDVAADKVGSCCGGCQG